MALGYSIIASGHLNIAKCIYTIVSVFKIVGYLHSTYIHIEDDKNLHHSYKNYKKILFCDGTRNV